MQLLNFIHVHNNFPSLSQHRTRCIFCNSNIALAWENSRYLVIPPLVSPRNDVWNSTEIPYLVWWRVATQTWALSFWLVVPLVKFASTNQQHYPNLGSDASSVWNFCARFSDVISGGNRSCVAKCRLFSQADITPFEIIVHWFPTKNGFLLS